LLGIKLHPYSLQPVTLLTELYWLPHDEDDDDDDDDDNNNNNGSI
jgi:hypothetical protein